MLQGSAVFVRKPIVLLVEDEPIIQKVHIAFLESLECSVDLAINGVSALKMYSSKYDLIFMDFGLPDIFGLEVTKIIRLNENQNRHVPIIALTAQGDINKQESFSAGVDEILIKPVSLEKLLNVLKFWLPDLVQ